MTEDEDLVSFSRYRLALTEITTVFLSLVRWGLVPRLPCALQKVTATAKIYIFFLFDISCDQKNLATTHLPHRKKEKTTESRLKTRARILCSRGCLWKSCWRLPAISHVWCTARGHMPGQDAQKKLHYWGSYGGGFGWSWLPWGGNSDVLSHKRRKTHRSCCRDGEEGGKREGHSIRWVFLCSGVSKQRRQNSGWRGSKHLMFRDRARITPAASASPQSSFLVLCFWSQLTKDNPRCGLGRHQPGQLSGCKILPTHNVSQLFLYVGNKADSR